MSRLHKSAQDRGTSPDRVRQPKVGGLGRQLKKARQPRHLTGSMLINIGPTQRAASDKSLVRIEGLRCSETQFAAAAAGTNSRILSINPHRCRPASGRYLLTARICTFMSETDHIWGK